jgi:integral membrane protein (TIGR00529 family)
MEHLLTLPATVKVLSAFAGILVLNRLGLQLGGAILVLSISLSLWSGTGAHGLRHLGVEMLLPRNYLLFTLILLLLFFNEALTATGRLERTITAIRRRIKSQRLVLAGLPAFIGLLPMPGGALFSAPLVAGTDPEGRLDPAHKSAINYWFRHIWEYWWPLYPGVVLAIQYTGVPAATFFLMQVPFSLAATAAGYFFILRRVHGADAPGDSTPIKPRDMLSTMGPILLLVLVSVAGSLVLPGLGVNANLANLEAMLAGMVLSLAWIFTGDLAALRTALGFFRKKNTWTLLAVIVGIQFFSASLLAPLDASGATLVYGMRDEFFRLGIPLLAVIVAIPFISGLVTGVAIGFVGASFPLVFSLLGAAPDPATRAGACALAYGFGYMGMIVSPVHICLVVSNEYFRSTVYGAYRYIWKPVLAVLASSVALAAAYYWLL